MAIVTLRPYQNLTTIVFIDGALHDLQTILSDLDPSVTAIVLDPEQDGIQQMADALVGMSGLEAIHIISHGASGQINLGTAQLTQDTLAQYQTQLATIGNALSDTGDLLLYGCNVAQGIQGQAFISSLASATDADVAASMDLTDSALLGGNWALEQSIGSVDAKALDLSATYQNSLLATTLIANNPNFSYSEAVTSVALANAAYQEGYWLGGELSALGWTPLVSQHAGYVDLNNGGFTGNGTLLQLFGATSAFAFAATRDVGNTMQFAISFRGSEASFVDWLSYNFGDHGFSRYYEALRPLVEETLWQAMQAKELDKNVEITFTGHSLGGAAVQAVLLDILIPKSQDVWIDALTNPLDTGDRLGQTAEAVNAFGATDWDTLLQSSGLLNDITAYTFGAPSISADDIVDYTPIIGFTYGSDPSLTTANRAWLQNRLFQFEHEDSNPLRGGDPVAHIGATDYGTVINVDLTEVIHDRYEVLFGAPVMHSMDGYEESLLRLITNSEVIKAGTAQNANGASLNVVNYGSANNDLIVDVVNAQGFAGNDILVASVPGALTMNGGSGTDSYIIKDYGLNVTICGPAGENIDCLYFNLLGQVSAEVSGENLVVTLASSLGQSTATIVDWYSLTNNYQIGEIAKIRPITANSWDKQYFSFGSLHIPLFNIGTANNDIIIGSLSADTMTGGAGNDDLNGRDGNDAIYGGAGADTLNGGSGTNTLYGESGADTYIIDVGTTSTYTTIADSSGNDLIIVNSDNADFTKTNFAVSGNDLIVEIRSTTNQLLTTIDIQSSSVMSAVEKLQFTRTSGSSQTYDLNNALQSVISGFASSAQPFSTGDFNEDIFTTDMVAVGSSTVGDISFQNDRDWFQVNLVQGHSYRFDVKGAPSGHGTLADPYMRLRDEAGISLLSDDNSGTGADAQINHTAKSSGLFFISVGSSDLTSTGTYKVFATDTTPAVTVLNSAPDVVGTAQALTAETTLSASNLFQGVDPDGDTIAFYTINDAAGSGYFQLNGVKQSEGSTFVVTAVQYDTLQYVIGSAGTSDTFVVCASDGHVWGAENTITVIGLASGTAPSAVAAQGDSATTTSGTPVVVNVLSNDTNLTRVTGITGTNTHATIQPGTQDSIIITPPLGFTGTYSFHYTAANDSGGTASALVTISVTEPQAVNQSPIAQDIHHIVVTGQQDIIDPLLFCSDPDANDIGLLSLFSYSVPNHGGLTRNGDILTYTPTADFSGDDVFSYVIQDPHGAQATGTVTLTVYQAATANDDFVVTDINTPVTFNILQNDIHTGSGQYILYYTSPAGSSFGPNHGTLTFTQDGQVTYTPEAGYSGMDSFNYRAEYNGTVNFTQAWVTIAVGASSNQQGGAGADPLTGTSGGEALYGNDGDDTLWGGAGNDILDGGAGFDTVSFANAPVGITVDLSLPGIAADGTIRWDDPYYWSIDGLGGRDSVRNCEAVIGSEFSDTIRGNNSDNVIYGNGGNDDIMTGLGCDTIYCGDGDDTVQSGGQAGIYTIYGGNGNDTLAGGPNNDVIDGGAGNDWLSDGLGGNDTITGGEGDDTFRCYGTGISILDGGDGNDSIWGNGTLIGGNGNDFLGVTSNGNDTLLGGAGDDTLFGGTGNDLLDGGAGYDTVTFRGERVGVTVDLASGFAQTSSGFKVLVSIEDIRGSMNANDNIYGSEAAETLYGDWGDDTLVGRGGNDIIDGGSGNDLIEGGEGADTLTGGGPSNPGGVGSDRFVYRSTLDGGDVITDFTVGSGGDILDFTDILSSAGYSGSTPSADGYLRLAVSGSSTTVLLDRDGSGTGAQFVALATLQNVAPSALTNANFATPVDLAVLVAAVPVSLSIEVVTTLQKPGTDTPAIYEGDSGNTDLIIRFVREGDLSVPLSATVDYAAGTGLDALDLAGGVPASGTIDFAPSQSTFEKMISIVGDTIPEADEKITVSISSLNATSSPSVSVWILTEENHIDGSGTLIGTSRTDIITGQEQDDFILSGEGNDILDGGTGADTLTGGAGNDSFRYTANTDSTAAAFDTITDFQGGDSIEFTGMVGIRWGADHYAFTLSLTQTVAAIQSDASLNNALVQFSDGTNNYLYIKGAGTGVDFGGTLISFTSTGVLSSSQLTGVVNSNPTGNITITGTTAKGQTLTASNTLADTDGIGTIGYQWQADGVNISGATNNTYLLTQAEVGKAISMVASYTDLYGTAEAVTSSSTANVYILPTSRYYVTQSPGSNLLDFELAYGTLSLQDEHIVFAGTSGTDNVSVVPGIVFDFTGSGASADKLYLTGNYGDYTPSLAGTTMTMTRTVGLKTETVKVVKLTSLANSDKLVFADGTVSTFDLSAYLNSTASAPVPAGETSLSPSLPATLSATVKAYAVDSTGETFAPVSPGINLMVMGSAAVDIVYVKAGSNVDAASLGGGFDKIYFTGNWSEYTKTVAGTTIIFERTEGTDAEYIKVAAATGSSNDYLVFADGYVRSNDAKTALQSDANAAIATVTGYSTTEITPLGTGDIVTGTAAADPLNGTTTGDIIYGNGGADTINGDAGNDTIVISDAGTTASSSATIQITSTAHGTDTVIGFSAAPVTSGGDVLDFSNIANLTDAVATGQTLTTDFNADNMFIFDNTPVTIADAASAIAADASVVATNGYIVLADSANSNAVTAYHSTDLAANGTETALVILSGVNITQLTAGNFLV